MTDPHQAGNPDPRSYTRRWLLRVGGALGLAATGATLSAATGADAGAAVPADAEDTTGAFGNPPAAEALRRQRRRAGGPVQSSVVAESGVVAGPEPISAAGVRLSPSATTIDSTPLARRTSGAPWTVKG
ncbi:hypothetical protein OG792_15925 [Micromonospora sp. NBC_01699]|uniref:hypothetical protein n=1 Tax=Micromonospora sp. NBC_01699 TaxID=2975984 RepID=UPI002E3364A1|nr:hypothetical protein [Micromonospora sp. NBC_01699]